MSNKTLIILFMLALLASCARHTIKIACIGDSITEGYGIQDANRNSYPSQMNNILGEGYRVFNCGRSGATLQKEGDLPYWKRSVFHMVFLSQPDIIIVQLGTNDTKPYNWNMERFAKDYQALVDTLKTLPNHPAIWLCYPVPVFRPGWGINDSTLTHGVIPVIQRAGEVNHLPIIDLYHEMSGQQANFPDGIHPNKAGAKKMAEIIAGKISP